jgi:hypothetical protein
MLPWETDPSMRDNELGAAFADVWCAIPKVLFSRTLDSVQGNARLAEASAAYPTITHVDPVALAATVGGSVVALAGVGATAWGIKQQRESAKELETSRQTHERLLASGARLFEKRSTVYEQMVRRVADWLEEVVATDPPLKMGDPPLPEPPSPDEQRALNAKLRTFGSKDVADAYDEFVKSMLEFYVFAEALRTLSEVQAANVPWSELEAMRNKVRADLATIERLVSDELASL